MFNDFKNCGLNTLATKRIQIDWTGFSWVPKFKWKILGWSMPLSWRQCCWDVNSHGMDDDPMISFWVYISRGFFPKKGIPTKSSPITIRPCWYRKNHGLGDPADPPYFLHLVDLPAHWHHVMFTTALHAAWWQAGQVIGWSKRMVTHTGPQTFPSSEIKHVFRTPIILGQCWHCSNRFSIDDIPC